MSRKQPCGCEIDSAMSGTVCLDHDIVYCPLHDSAPEMLEMLKRVRSALLGHGVYGWSNDIDAIITKASSNG